MSGSRGEGKEQALSQKARWIEFILFALQICKLQSEKCKHGSGLKWRSYGLLEASNTHLRTRKHSTASQGEATRTAATIVIISSPDRELAGSLHVSCESALAKRLL